MSGQDSLEELQLNIQEALEDEIVPNDRRRPGLLKKKNTCVSVRDISQFDTTTPESLSKTEVLESWQSLVQALFALQVFLQYTPALERCFTHWNLEHEAEKDNVKTVLDLMTATVNNHDKDPSTEHRYVTLMEVLTSYGPNWEFSQQIERVWTVLQQDIDINMEPEDFRKAAYRVLMSLPWVPNSPGLRQACSIADDDIMDEVPLAVQSVFDQIRSTPLPRHDSVHRVLSHLEDETNTIVSISANLDESFRASSRRCQGLGKTTLAAIVASMPQVQSKYNVLWLSLKHRTSESPGMTYRDYVQYLDELCEQLGLQHEWPQPTRVLEERSLQKKREEEKMFQVKLEMEALLRRATSHVLLILDDVNDDLEIEWFRFMDGQSLLVTTQAQNLSVDWTLELGLLSEEEALELFLTEADYSRDDALGSSLEAKSIVQRCGYHPLTIRTVGRWFSLKEVTAGVVKAVEELDQELSRCTAKLRHSRSYRANSEYILIEAMNLTLSPVLASGGRPTTLMKTCLASLGTVFDELPSREASGSAMGSALAY